MKKEKIKVATLSGARFRAFLLEIASQVKDSDSITAQKGNDKAMFQLADTAIIIGRIKQ